MRVIVTGGGTGGHVYPALSIIEELKDKEPSLDVIYVGTERGIESRIVKDKGIKFETLEVEGLNRKLGLDTIKRVFKLMGSLVRANALLKQYRPDFVIGTGGYVSFPVLYMAAKKKIPVFIHEQNAYPGVANKILSRWARLMFISFPDSMDYLNIPKERLVLSGNPVRKQFNLMEREDCRKAVGIEDGTKLIVGFGGSGGARKINDLVIELAKTLGTRKDIRVIHATGVRYYKEVSKRDDLPDNLVVLEYIDDMPTVMGASDLIIGRSGAITLAEISTLGLPSILMPSPNVANDHQMENAKSFEKAGAAMIVKENGDDLSDKILKIIRLVDDDEKLKKMGKNSNRVLLHNAAHIIVDEILKQIK
jgi:UDP-N-acetylglucosamine--N-acetylmuramyl-(pentapeptide) pyrophosphoryl-undecaprenol N-acetylglucosamine transferase